MADQGNFDFLYIGGGEFRKAVEAGAGVHLRNAYSGKDCYHTAHAEATHCNFL